MELVDTVGCLGLTGCGFLSFSCLGLSGLNLIDCGAAKWVVVMEEEGSAPLAKLSLLGQTGTGDMKLQMHNKVCPKPVEGYSYIRTPKKAMTLTDNSIIQLRGQGEFMRTTDISISIQQG